MAFRKKAGVILEHEPDILIVPECEHPDKLKYPASTKIPTSTIWFGANQHKGLGVFSYGDYQLELLPGHNPDIKIILPIAVTNGSIDFTLFAIWAYNANDPNYKYIGQVWKAILYYEPLLKKGKVIVAGDFNSNTIWDTPKRKISHSAVVKKLEDLHIYSTYHHHLGMTQGVEEHATFFLYRHLNKPYHIDYCFASQDFIDKMEKVTVGSHEHWKQHSDHSPLLVSFNL